MQFVDINLIACVSTFSVNGISQSHINKVTILNINIVIVLIKRQK